MGISFVYNSIQKVKNIMFDSDEYFTRKGIVNFLTDIVLISTRGYEIVLNPIIIMSFY